MIDAKKHREVGKSMLGKESGSSKDILEDSDLGKRKGDFGTLHRYVLLLSLLLMSMVYHGVPFAQELEPVLQRSKGPGSFKASFSLKTLWE